MLFQPQPDHYFDGFNEFLVDRLPASAKRILEIGCARGRLGHELKQRDPERFVVGVELNPEAAEVARSRLDEVHVLDIQRGLPPVPHRSFDCVIFGDVLEHLYDPEQALIGIRDLLKDDGVVLVCVPNIGHWSVIKALLRSDLMYQPSGLLDATHIRFFTHATFIKLLMDAGFLPSLEAVIPSPTTEEFIHAATPLLRHAGMYPDRGRKYLEAYQYIFQGRRLPDVAAGFSATPITFVACVNDEEQLHSNLLRSPCLEPGTPPRGDLDAAPA